MIDNTFIAHESGTDAEGRSETRWLAWVAEVERLTGLSSLDGDQVSDGYSLDYAHHAWVSGRSAAEHAALIRSAVAAPAICAGFIE